MKYTIVLVEDEVDLNNLIKVYLEKAGYNVIQYYNGQDAIDNTKIEAHLWILDIMLPDEISGYDIIKKIREENEQMPVIFTSARDKELDKIIGLELGSDDYITKPYSPKELVLRVNNIIKRVYSQDLTKIKYEDYIIGYVGTCCSFGGSWFNGYARFNPNKNEDHIKEAYNGLKKQVKNFIGLKKTVFLYSSYDRVLLHKNDIVYCDPPYAMTKRYISDFNNDAFWEWAREASKKVKKLYISEYDAPSDFKCIWQMDKKDSLGTQKGKKQNTKVEKLFVYNGK